MSSEDYIATRETLLKLRVVKSPNYSDVIGRFKQKTRVESTLDLDFVDTTLA